MNQTLTAVVVTPGTASLVVGAHQAFAARANDQFSAKLATQPAFACSVSGVGSINASGVYTAPSAPGSATVRATAGALSGTASVTVSSASAAAVSVSYRTTNDWGAGFTGEVTLTNNGAAPVNGWTVAFDAASNLSQIWSGTIVSHIGTRYVVKDAGYNATIAPGQSVSFGFVADRVGSSGTPANFVVNGTSTPPPPPSGSFDAGATYDVTNDWGTGFTGSVTLANTGTLAIAGWTLEFDFAANIMQIWGGQIVSHVGNHYIVRDAGYNAAIAAGQSTSFGFVASRADGVNGPAIALLTDAHLHLRRQEEEVRLDRPEELTRAPEAASHTLEDTTRGYPAFLKMLDIPLCPSSSRPYGIDGRRAALRPRPREVAAQPQHAPPTQAHTERELRKPLAA